MDKKLRQMQLKILSVFSKHSGSFALSGGTALELYYLHHRFSADLDFFSPTYDTDEIESLISEFKKATKSRIAMQAELTVSSRARVRFYTVSIKAHKRPLKIDFVEEVLLKKPSIRKFNGLPVYSVKDMYFKKIATITGSELTEDEIGRQVTQGRIEARDAFDIYVLSKEVEPLHVFLEKLPRHFQRGMAHWYQSFSRQDLKLGLLDLDIYDKKFDSRGMIIYLENEMKEFMKRVLQ